MQCLIDERKKIIQNRLHEELRILVDVPKPGFGNTNDGNTARIFFNNVDTVSNITGKNKDCFGFNLILILKK